MHHLQRKHCTMNSGMNAPSQTATMHHDQRSMRTIRHGVFSAVIRKNFHLMESSKVIHSFNEINVIWGRSKLTFCYSPFLLLS